MWEDYLIIVATLQYLPNSAALESLLSREILISNKMYYDFP